MNMLLCIDAIAKRYSLLPHQVLSQASTFDLVVLDAVLGYEQYVIDKKEGKSPKYDPTGIQRIWDEFNKSKRES